jgi:hypothetical protein
VLLRAVGSQGEAASLLFVRDSEGNVFGGFASAPWDPHAQYYGNGECFLFSCGNAESKEGGGNLDVFRWTEKNNYFMLANEDSIAMGGGGNFGLYLDGDLFTGTSGKSLEREGKRVRNPMARFLVVNWLLLFAGECETFGSTALTPEEDFECAAVELWGFEPCTQRPVATAAADGD